MTQLREQNRIWIDGVARTVESLGRVSLMGGDSAKVAVIGDAGRLVDAAVGFFRQRRDGVLLPIGADTAELLDALRGAGYALLWPDRAQAADPHEPAVPGRVCVLTSGSTGTPKLVPHTWESLFTATRVDARARRWLATYQPGTYAWYQLLTLSMFVPGQELVVPAAPDPEAVLAAGIDAGADAVSATPTFWQYLHVRVGTDGLAALAPEQVTLGGEPVRQPVLDMLRTVYPDARISHIYASSEAGVGVVVHDGKEGFPASWLSPSRSSTDAPAGRPGLHVEDDELWIRSRHASVGVEGWIRSGDEVVVRGDRVVVVGRKNDDRLIVGGQKVSRARVTSAVGDHPLVRWCRVSTRRSPVGAAVAAEVVADPAMLRDGTAAAEIELTRFAREHGVPDWAVPRIWRFLEQVPIEQNRKTR